MSGLVTNGSLSNATRQSSFNVTGDANPKNQTYVDKSIVTSKGVNAAAEKIIREQRRNEAYTAAGKIIDGISNLCKQAYAELCVWRNGPRPQISCEKKDAIRSHTQARQQTTHIQQLEDLEGKVRTAIDVIFQKGWNKLSVEKAAAKIVEYIKSNVFCDPNDDGRKWLDTILKRELIETEQQDLTEALERILQKDKTPRITNRRLILEKNIFSALEKSTLWNESAKKRIVESVVKYLESGVSKNREDVKKWIAEVLEENLGWEEFRQTVRSLRMEKRMAIPFTLSEKMAIDPNTTITADRLVMCGSGNEVMFHYATNTSQVVQLYSLQNDTLSRIAAASDAINALMPGRLGSNFISAACKRNVYQIITLSGQPGPWFYHTTIKNQSLDIPQYPMNFTNAPSSPIPAYAPRPAIINDRLSFGYYPVNASSSLVETLNFVSNSSGYFSTQQATGIFSRSEWKANKVYQEALSLENGNVIILGDGQLYNVAGLMATKYNTSYTYPFFNDYIKMGFTNLTQDIYNQTINMPYASRTPLPVNLSSTSLINQLANLSTILQTLDLNSLTITSSKILPDAPQQLVADATMDIAHCPQPQRPNVHVYVRGIANGIKFDLLDSADGTSLFGGEQTYTNIAIGSARLQASVNCLDNDNIILSFLDGNKPVRIELRVGTSGQTPVDQDSGDVEIVVTIPPNLTQEFVPITVTIVSISPNTVSVTLTDANGYQFVFLGNSSAVPLNTPFKPEDVYTFGLGLGNATKGSVPVFEGCNAAGRCNTSVAGGLEKIFNTGDDNIKIIVPTVIAGAAGLAALVTFLIKKLWYDKLQKERVEKYERSRIITEPESKV